MDKWISVKDTGSIPPEELVQVMDGLGNKALATPTYYPFTIEKLPGDERKCWGWRGTPVPCDNHWDGGWMIEHENLKNPLSGDITHWKPFEGEKEIIA